MEKEMLKIIDFIKTYVEEDETVVIPVSGGIDSDVTARLCHKALGKNRIKLFIIEENDLENKYIGNARKLAADLEVELTEIDLKGKSEELIKILEKSEKGKIFNSNSILEIGKVKCSYRSSIISCYQDKGYVIAGCTNRTEYELGFFVTFGDNLANFKPIEHLYKHEVIDLAKLLKTDKDVINEQPSSGFWANQEDLEDIAYWIVNKGPILRQRNFDEEDIKKANKIRKKINWEKIDSCLLMIRQKKDIREIVKCTKLPTYIVEGIFEIVKKAKKYKNRKILISMR